MSSDNALFSARIEENCFDQLTVNQPQTGAGDRRVSVMDAKGKGAISSCFLSLSILFKLSV